MSNSILTIAKKAKTVTQAAASLHMARGTFKVACLNQIGGEKVFTSLKKRGYEYRSLVRRGEAPRIQARYDGFVFAGTEITYAKLLNILETAESAAVAATKIGLADGSQLSRLHWKPTIPPAILKAYRGCVARGHKLAGDNRRGPRDTDRKVKQDKIVDVDFDSNSESRPAKKVCCGACHKTKPIAAFAQKPAVQPTAHPLVDRMAANLLAILNKNEIQELIKRLQKSA